MELTSKLYHIDLRSTFLNPTPLSNLRKPYFRPQIRPISLITNSSTKPPIKPHTHHPIRLSAVAVDTEAATITTADEDDIESLFSKDSSETVNYGRGNKQSGNGASSISFGVRLENISKSYKGVNSAERCELGGEKGEKVGLVGVNGAGKTGRRTGEVWPKKNREDCGVVILKMV